MKSYFSHDLNARHDRKLVRLFKELKLSGIGAYWCIIEMLHEEGGKIPLSEIENIAYQLRVKPEFIEKVLNGFELFSKSAEHFWSESALLRIAFKESKSVKAKESAAYRWEKDANAMRPHSDPKCDGNALNNTNDTKGNKRKESTPLPPPTHPLSVFVQTNYPNVCKLPKQLTDDEAERLVLKFTKEDIKEVLDGMENKKDLLRKYQSVNLTIQSWMKLRKEKTGSLPKPNTYIPPVDLN